MTERKYLVALSSYIFFGPARVKLLLSFFGSARKVWHAQPQKLIEIGFKKERVADFTRYRSSFDIDDYFTKLNKLKIATLTLGENGYPENLRNIEGAPPVLYVKGELKASDINAIAVVGSRKMTSYGKEVAEKFSGELASFGVTIISGLARGIDSVAHKAALAAGGRTVAVLGCGLDSIYPPENAILASAICKSGALISEYPLGHPALPINFASRNRIVSGLSRGVLVVEGAEKSGTLLTAGHAAEQGKTVFAVPGQVSSPLSFAPLYLIKNGAKMATATKDILEELDIETKVNRAGVEKALPASESEEKLLAILVNEPMHLDELARISTYPASEVSARLTVMELKGMVKNLGGGVYKKV